jgi:hypothetical protein
MENFRTKVKNRKESFSGKQFEEALKNAYQMGINDLKKSLTDELNDASEDSDISKGIFKAIFILNDITE